MCVFFVDQLCSWCNKSAWLLESPGSTLTYFSDSEFSLALPSSIFSFIALECTTPSPSILLFCNVTKIRGSEITDFVNSYGLTTDVWHSMDSWGRATTEQEKIKLPKTGRKYTRWASKYENVEHMTSTIIITTIKPFLCPKINTTLQCYYLITYFKRDEQGLG